MEILKQQHQVSQHHQQQTNLLVPTKLGYDRDETLENRDKNKVKKRKERTLKRKRKRRNMQ
jgi:hypothetical protein